MKRLKDSFVMHVLLELFVLPRKRCSMGACPSIYIMQICTKNLNWPSHLKKNWLSYGWGFYVDIWAAMTAVILSFPVRLVPCRILSATKLEMEIALVGVKRNGDRNNTIGFDTHVKIVICLKSSRTHRSIAFTLLQCIFIFYYFYSNIVTSAMVRVIL